MQSKQPKCKPIAEYKKDLKDLYEQKAELIKQRIETENLILKKEGSVIYLGYSYAERLTGHLSKNLSAEKRISVLERFGDIDRESKKPYNKFYAIKLDELKKEIRRVGDEIAHIKRKITCQEQADNKHENEPISVKDFIGKENYSDMTKDERRAYQRAIKRREEELRKMELGLPPYDKIKIKKL